MLKEMVVYNTATFLHDSDSSQGCGCRGDHTHAESDILGTPAWEFANPLGDSQAVSVANSGSEDGLLGLPAYEFANPLVKAAAPVGNRSQEEPVGSLPWHFPKPF